MFLSLGIARRITRATRSVQGVRKTAHSKPRQRSCAGKLSHGSSDFREIASVGRWKHSQIWGLRFYDL